MKKIISRITIAIAVAIALPTMSFAMVINNQEQYPNSICKEMYDTIGVLLTVADNAWKSQDEEKALFYSTAAANYATVYEVTCKR